MTHQTMRQTAADIVAYCCTLDGEFSHATIKEQRDLLIEDSFIAEEFLGVVPFWIQDLFPLEIIF
jgi:hypothetical protein